MNWLLKHLTIIDPSAPDNGHTLDIHIADGRIQAIALELKVENASVFEVAGACVSPGWIDVGVQACDPGYEDREDLQSAARAAAAGGYTAMVVQPNTLPVLDSKSEILYILKNTRHLPVDCYPIGAVSENCNGKDITEMLDMHTAGAIAFSDGKKAIQDSGLMLRALQYVLPFNGLIINQPLDAGLTNEGQMHEGLVSTVLGLRGIPAIAEELMVERDLNLLAYAGSRLHIANVSTAGAVARIRAAKAQGLQVTASVAALNLLLDEEALGDFDSNCKVMPPLRSSADRAALIAGLADSTLDFIVSNHSPINEENKKREFPYAEFGAIGLETAFAAARTALQNSLKIEALIVKLALRPRQILGLPVPRIAVGETANLTIFDPNRQWTFRTEDIRSKSHNNPLVGHTLTGRVLAIINNHQSEFFHHP